MKKMHYDKLYSFVEEVLAKCQLDDYSLNSVAIGLCETSLRGVDSHGVRLLHHYANSAISGRKNPKPNFKVNNSYPSIAHLNADDAFGHAAGMKAIDIGIEIADKQGIGVVAVSDSSHPGAMASMALKAARQGYIAFAFTHADALIKSHNGKRPYFGTNPVCFAAPREEIDPYCLDMATSIVPWNRVLIHKSGNTLLDDAIAIDAEGNVTNDPYKAVGLLPVGSYKGYGLASMIDVLCGVYTGMAFGRNIPAMYKAKMNEQRKLGQFYMILKVDGVVSSESFICQLQEMTNEVRLEPAYDGEKVLLPGDKEIIESKERMKNGIPLDDDTVIKFIELSERLDVNLEFLN